MRFTKYTQLCKSRVLLGLSVNGKNRVTYLSLQLSVSPMYLNDSGASPMYRSDLKLGHRDLCRALWRCEMMETEECLFTSQPSTSGLLPVTLKDFGMGSQPVLICEPLQPGPDPNRGSEGQHTTGTSPGALLLPATCVLIP